MRGPFGPLSCTCTSIHARVCACTWRRLLGRVLTLVLLEVKTWLHSNRKRKLGVFVYVTYSSRRTNLVLLPLAMPLLFCSLNPLIVDVLPVSLLQLLLFSPPSPLLLPSPPPLLPPRIRMRFQFGKIYTLKHTYTHVHTHIKRTHAYTLTHTHMCAAHALPVRRDLHFKTYIHARTHTY